MGVTSFTVLLSDSMKDFIERKANAGGFGTASEYVRELIREAQRREARERVEPMLLPAVQGGPPTEMEPDDWANLKRRVASLSSRGTAA